MPSQLAGYEASNAQRILFNSDRRNGGQPGYNPILVTLNALPAGVSLHASRSSSTAWSSWMSSLACLYALLCNFTAESIYLRLIGLRRSSLGSYDDVIFDLRGSRYRLGRS